jgi:hypothetical protein
MSKLRSQLALLILATGIFASPACFGQSFDVTGQWQVRRPSGNYDVTLNQLGNQVSGTYHLGKLGGTLAGNVLTGNYSDIMTSGAIQFTFSPDGTRFKGVARGSEPWEGTRIVKSTVTPGDVISMRARLSDLQGAKFETRLFEGCKNVFGATYAGAGAETWVTSYLVGPNAFAPVLGATAGVQYIEVRGVEPGAVRSRSPNEADVANGLQYSGTAQVMGRMSRIGSQEGWAPWQMRNSAIFRCDLVVTNRGATMTATDLVMGIDAAKLAPPKSVPPN